MCIRDRPYTQQPQPRQDQQLSSIGLNLVGYGLSTEDLMPPPSFKPYLIHHQINDNLITNNDSNITSNTNNINNSNNNGSDNNGVTPLNVSTTSLPDLCLHSPSYSPTRSKMTRFATSGDISASSSKSHLLHQVKTPTSTTPSHTIQSLSLIHI